MSKQIVVIGSINLDLVASAARIPQKGETVHGQSFQTFLGGKGANQAVAASRLGAAVTMIGKIGNDSFGLDLKRGLETAGVNTAGIRKGKGSSGVALITTDRAAHNSIVVIPGANDQLEPRDLERYRKRIEAAAVVLTQLEIPIPTIEFLATITLKSKVPLVLDPAPALQLSRKLIRAVTWLTPNETESATLLQNTYSPSDIAEVSERILAMGCRNVVLKLGARGVFLAGRDTEPHRIGGFKVRAVDTTAAGDAFNGAFAVALTQGKSPIESARFACAVAAISVTRKGAQPSMPRLKETNDFIRQHKGRNRDSSELRRQILL